MPGELACTAKLCELHVSDSKCTILPSHLWLRSLHGVWSGLQVLGGLSENAGGLNQHTARLTGRRAGATSKATGHVGPMQWVNMNTQEGSGKRVGGEPS